MHRLKEFDPVALALPDEVPTREPSFPCRVIAKAGPTVALEPVDGTRTSWLPARLPGVFPVFRHDGALNALKGVLVHERRDDLRFIVTDDIALGRASRPSPTTIGA